MKNILTKSETWCRSTSPRSGCGMEFVGGESGEERGWRVGSISGDAEGDEGIHSLYFDCKCRRIVKGERGKEIKVCCCLESKRPWKRSVHSLSCLGPKKRIEKRERKGECARGSFPFQICIRVCCMEKPSKRGRKGGRRRRWLNRAASVCVLKNGDYDLGAQYFDLDSWQDFPFKIAKDYRV